MICVESMLTSASEGDLTRGASRILVCDRSRNSSEYNDMTSIDERGLWARDSELREAGRKETADQIRELWERFRRFSEDGSHSNDTI